MTESFENFNEDQKVKELVDIALEFEDLEEDPVSADNLDIDIVTNIATFSINEYNSKFKTVFKKPIFQRNSIWNTKTKSRLIESFLKGYPVPPIMLYQLPKDEGYWVVDGWQRLNTISDFFNNKFSLSLKNDSILSGKKFKQLTGELEKYKNRLENNTFLSAMIIRAIEPKDDTFLYNVFERINTSSVALKAMEIRRAISSGKLVDMLERLNKDENWRKIFGQPKENERFFDLELILRVLALYENFNTKELKLYNYNNMRQFLDAFMAHNKNKEFKDFENRFVNICGKLVSAFDDESSNIFNMKSSKRMNYLIFDSIMNALLHITHVPNETLKSKIISYKNSEKAKEVYNDLSSTTSLSKVEYRLKLAYEIIVNDK